MVGIPTLGAFSAQHHRHNGTQEPVMGHARKQIHPIFTTRFKAYYVSINLSNNIDLKDLSCKDVNKE